MIHQQFKLHIFLIFYLLSILISAQNFDIIKVSGNKNFSENDYREWIRGIQFKKDSATFHKELQSLIHKNISKYGYYNFILKSFSFDSLNSEKSLILELVVNESSQTIIKNILTEFEEAVDTAIFNKEFKIFENSVFYQDEIENKIAYLIEDMENSGYPFVRLKIKSVYFFDENDTHFADIHLLIDNGKKTTIDKVEIIGNTKTGNSVIVNNLRLKAGELYSQRRISEIPKILNRLRFFNSINNPKFYFDAEDRGILQIVLTEKETNNFDGILGYVPPGKSESKGYFTGYVNISLRNLFGTGRGAAIRWQQENRFTQELELKYLEPWLFNYPFNLKLNLFQRKQDTVYVQRTLGGELEFLATENVSASMIIENESIIPSENISFFTVYNSSSLNTGLQLTIDTRDDLYTPREGFYFISTYKYKSKKINGPSKFLSADSRLDFNLQKYELDFGYFYELFNRQVAALSVHGREIRGDFLEMSDYYKLGGTNSLRGYRENQFLGNRIFWSNLEYRYLLSPRSFIFGLFDTGYYLLNGSDANNLNAKAKFNFGYGLGLSIETALGIMKISYALANGNSFSDGLIHFGLLNDF